MANWLEELKAGDEVVIDTYHRTEIRRVARTTATQIVVGGEKFRRSDGRLIGQYHGFCRPNIEPVTQEVRDKLRRAALLHEIASLSATIHRDRDRISTETLEQIVEAMKQPQG